MNKLYDLINDTKKLCYFAFTVSLILHIAAFIVFYFNGAILMDESLTLLNGRFLADYGSDCFGEHLPIYFDNWIFGGQSPFATYLVALMVKVFGYNLAVTRIPMLLFSELGLIAFYFFLKNLHLEEKYVNVVFLLACFSPWHIFNSVYTLDCNFMPHILMVGMAFLSKAINTKKSVHFVFSMIFFALCFYCYIASSIIVTLILFITYILLLRTNRISIKNAIISVVAFTVVALPFILSGLVQLDIIDDFKLFGFSISKMPNYDRSQTLSFKHFYKKLFNGILMTVFPDIFIFKGIGMMNSFNYTNFTGGIALLSGIYFLIATYLKKLNKELSLVRIFSFAFIVTYIINVSLTFFYTATYRYYSFNYILILIEGIGFVYISKKIKSISLKKIVAIFLFISVIISSANYYLQFNKEALNSNYWYINSFTESVEYAEKLGYKSIAICFDNDEETHLSPWSRNSVALRLYDYDNIESFYSLEDELSTFINCPTAVPLTKDNHYYYKEIKKNESVIDECLIMTNEEIKIAKFDKSKYKTISFGEYAIAYK